MIAIAISLTSVILSLWAVATSSNTRRSGRRRHRPSLVLELPNSPKFVMCLVCEKPWPCPSMKEDQ